MDDRRKSEPKSDAAGDAVPGGDEATRIVGPPSLHAADAGREAASARAAAAEESRVANLLNEVHSPSGEPGISSLPLDSDSTVHRSHLPLSDGSSDPVPIVVNDNLTTGERDVSSSSDSSLRRSTARRADSRDLHPTEGDSHRGDSDDGRRRPGSSVTRSLEMHGIPEASTEEKTVISKRPLTADIPLPIPTTPQSLGVALVGKRLEHYELIEFVGGGGMGAVFRAHDTRLGRTVAVKVLSRDSNDEETIRRFRNEAQSAARLDHPNIARVYYVGEEQGWNFIVFEFIDGTNLRQLVEQRGPLPLDEALRYTLFVARALEHAASRDVVHRDIKPSNVLVTPDGHVKLVDMGLARLHQVESSSEDLTASGVTLGTFDYISPEQARDPRSADVRSDIYSLGCTLYYMLVAQPPFPEGTALQKLLRHNGVDPPDVRQLRPDVPPRVSTLLLRMLAKRPVQRHQTPAELIRDIMSLAEQLGLVTLSGDSQTSVTIAPAEPPLWMRAAILAVPAVVVIVGLLAVEWIFPPQSEIKSISLRPAGMSSQLTAPGSPTTGDSSTGVSTDATSNGDAGTTSNGNSTGADSAITNDQTSPAGSGDDKLNGSNVGRGASAESGAAGSDSLPQGSKNGGTPDRGVTESSGIGASPVDPSATVSSNSPGTGTIGRPVPSPKLPTDLEPSALPSERIPGTTGTSVATLPERSETTEVGPPEISASLEPDSTNGSASISVDVSQPPVAAAAISIRKVRVVAASELANAEPGVLHVDSLASACRRAAELEVTDVELAFDGPIVERPFEITAPKLAIRAASGRRPEIVFRPELLGLDAQRRMIQLPESATGQIILDGIQWRLELPPDPSYGWSLFSLRQIAAVDLYDCVITVRDQGPSGLPQHDQVAVFAIEPRKLADAMQMDDDDTMATPISLQLERTLVRGEAVLVSMIEETPLKLVWRQGLLATSKRMIETGGTPRAPKWFGGIEVDLENVTISAGQGLYTLKRRAGAIHHLPLDMKVNHCVLVTSAGSPLFEFSDVAGVEDVRLRYGGEDNRYAREDLVFLRVRPTGGAAVQDYDMKNRGTWSDEHRVDVGVTWQAPAPSDLPASDHRKSHYEFSTMSMAREGFSSELIPVIEDASVAPKPADTTTQSPEVTPAPRTPRRIDSLMPPLPADRDAAPAPPASIR